MSNRTDELIRRINELEAEVRFTVDNELVVIRPLEDTMPTHRLRFPSLEFALGWLMGKRGFLFTDKDMAMLKELGK